ncbi:hypothetical protein FE781_04340 [Paenibacillus thermoaerophilus]|nr:hypothetical protein FE781_04340 [Paenibacillus thermoaerophilus]
MYDVKMDLMRDWIDTVKEVFRGSGRPLEEGLSDSEIAFRYFLETAEDERQARERAAAHEERFRMLDSAIRDNLESLIVPDIRKRTGYQGNEFQFNWVYNQGEHIVEMRSEYRIPLQ